MPVYPYRCDSCGNYTEIFKPMSGANIPAACKCGQLMRRVFTPIGFSFGWRISERSLYGGKGSPKEELERAL